MLAAGCDSAGLPVIMHQKRDYWMPRQASVTTGGAAGAFATALAALALFRGMLDKCKQSWSVLGTATQHIARPTVLLSQGVDTTVIYSLNAWEASGMCMT